ncbi:MAG: hypothetical protein H0T89_10460 [Deltaproteobacteria bacterium]|nr:hypothetical protein [Deltaproteobacteria bacterium]MDQ3296255.1 hypothetical protein [Myxococcota bacterium]
MTSSAALWVVAAALGANAACDDSRYSQDTNKTHDKRVQEERREPQTRPNANTPAIGGGGQPIGANPDRVYQDAGVTNNPTSGGNATGGTGASRTTTPAPTGR